MAIEESDSIAVIGMAYRAPSIGGKGLWEYLSQARSAWTKIPEHRFDASAYYKPGADKTGVFRAEGAHFVPDDIYAFDAAFFNMRAEEARNSDPQHRMMLECALEAAEDAGHTLLDLAGKTIGVYIGSGQQEYSQRLGDDPYAAKTWSATGVAPCMVANRISYFFDIYGPSIALDAACASSVYAAHQAVSALQNRECEAAFVGSAALTLGPGGWLALEKTGALSVHGRSYSYDEKAAGFGRGEGAGCILIKRLSDAIRDGDPVQALIRGSAVNHGGRSEGITMPNGVAHRILLRTVHETAGLDPAETPVIEGHGTGTGAGDPIEAGAFTAILAKDRTEANPIYIGSIKSNFGHLEGASGMLGMIKAVMMVRNGVVLPTAGFERINPKIQGKEKIRVPDVPVPWPQGEKRRALVTNFGFGGSNSAIIFEQAPEKAKSLTNGTNGAAKAEVQQLFVLSARSEKSLNAYISLLNDHLDEIEEDDHFAKNLSYTLGQRRTAYSNRVAVVASSIDELTDKLATVKPSRISERVLAFAFTGQGAQHAQMAAGLHRYPVFADALNKADSALKNIGATWSLKAELAKSKTESRVDEAEISQPACTAVQLGLIALLKSWGVTPTAVTGHSSGEIASAYSAGLLSFRSALAVAYYRGVAAARLSQSQRAKGGMVALGVGPDAATKLIQRHAGGYATVAAINSNDSVTVSGDVAVIDNIHKAAEAEGLFSRKLNVQMAYHSKHMEAIASFYLNAIKPYCNEAQPRLAARDEVFPSFSSSVFGSNIAPEQVDVSYWVKNLIQPVRFSDAMHSLLTQQGAGKAAGSKLPDLIIEVGPHAALKNPIKQALDRAQAERKASTTLSYQSALLRGTPADEAFLNLAGSLFVAGVSVQLGEVNQTNLKNAEVITGLPGYAYDKSTTYEMKPRATHEKMFPGDPYHQLLGRRIASSGGKERAYRQNFTLDEFPWIRDHNVAGAVIFPMTGYMSCAIEAARRTLSSPAAAFLVRDFHVVARLEIQEEEIVDMITKIRPAPVGEGAFSSTNWSFEISAHNEENGWTIHAYGVVEPETTEMSVETPTLKSSLPLVDTIEGLIQHDIEYTYDYAGVRATRYGPTFRNSVAFYEADGYTVLEHKLRDLGATLQLPTTYGSPVTVDPPTLDGFLQGGGPLQKTEDGRRPAQMPNHINRFRVSNNIPSEPGQRFDIVTRLLDYDIKGGRMHIGVAAFARSADGKTLTPIAEWESAAFRSIGSADEDIDPVSSLPDNWAWENLDRFDYLPKKVLEDRYKVGDVKELILSRGDDLDKASRWYIGRAMKETAGDDRTKLPHHLSQSAKWFQKHVEPDEMDFDTEPTEFLEKVRKSDGQGDLLCTIGENLVPILRGEIEPLELMLPDGKLTRHYEADVMNAELSQVLGEMVKGLSDLEPNLRILEIGAGTGGTTLPVLKALSAEREDGAFMNYTFTDISSGFFENARKKLAQWPQRITYKKLDISQDPFAQGFNPEEFDIVIAANVLHATEDMYVTMTNLRSLMKPRGKLMLLEANVHRAMILPFIILPGWWYATDKYRDHSEGPMMPVSVWSQLLEDCGFTGVEAVVHDQPGANHTMSIMSATRIGKQDANTPITVSGPFLDDEEVDFAQSVADAISEKLGCPVDLKPFAEIDRDTNAYYVFIDSPRASALDKVDSGVFATLQNLLAHNAGILWVVPEGGSPESKFIKGMMRTLRIENEPKSLLILDETPISPQGVEAITRLAEMLRDPEITRVQDMDYVWSKDSIHMPRMRLRRELREQFAVEQGLSFRKEQNIWKGDQALEMTVDTAGTVDSVFFRRTKDLQLPLGDDEVIVQVAAAGVSYRDLSLILGHLPWAPPGFDGAGQIVKAGPKVKNVKAGDKVFFLSLDASAFSTYKKVASWHVAKAPANLDATSVASIPLAYSMAVLALDRTARIRKGETVLIHSAAGAIGQACVVLAQHRGAKIFATAGTKAKREFLESTFGIPQERIFSSRNAHFRDAILVATGNKGVDVIINSAGGELLTETWALAAKFGRFIDIGKKDAFENNNLPMKPFDSSVTFTAIDIRGLYQHRPEEIREIFEEVSALVQKGIAKPIGPISVHPISQFAASLRKLRSGDNIGKVIVTFGQDEAVLAESNMRPTKTALHANATYIITGGTKGIGLNLTYWMVDNGAKNVIVLGRSGATGSEVKELLKKYQGTDVTVRALACDVGSRDQVIGVLNSIEDLPPVRGVIHSALLLSDKLFENATFEDWQTIYGPRVTGAWNLDELLPKNMDFFIALGSFLGDTGNGGQAIYAGTAVFYDALAKLRNARGEHTVAVALPVVLDVGYVATNNLSAILKETLGATLTMADIRTIIKGAVMGKDSPFHNQGKIAAFKMYLNGKAVIDCPWKYVHPVLAKERLKDEREKGNTSRNSGGSMSSASWTAAEDPLVGLTEALITKVSAMTMIDREEIGADSPIADFGLDSLVSVELRNWIRRETQVELQLSAITKAENLRALAGDILAQIGTTA